MTIRFRPYAENDMETLRRFAVEPDLIGLDWSGFRDPEAPVRRFAQDGYLSTENGRDARLIVETNSGAIAPRTRIASRVLSGRTCQVPGTGKAPSR